MYLENVNLNCYSKQLLALYLESEIKIYLWHINKYGQK
jgi:hypothetical protein